MKGVLRRCVWAPGMMTICPDCPLEHSSTVLHRSTPVVQIELRLRAQLPALNSALKTRLSIEVVSVWADMGSGPRDKVVTRPRDTPQHRTPPLTHSVATSQIEGLAVCDGRGTWKVRQWTS